jgi:hypothetical protein
MREVVQTRPDTLTHMTSQFCLPLSSRKGGGGGEKCNKRARGGGGGGGGGGAIHLFLSFDVKWVQDYFVIVRELMTPFLGDCSCTPGRARLFIILALRSSHIYVQSVKRVQIASIFLSEFDIVDPADPLRQTPGGGPHPDYLLESPMSDGTIEEDFEAALARDMALHRGSPGSPHHAAAASVTMSQVRLDDGNTQCFFY